ncbi:MAG TPA: hypothetical protein VM263_06255 [Acidimicrobiales bacterium]|nr:hypothetical protein [Acidimicrobiales bacterium]
MTDPVVARAVPGPAIAAWTPRVVAAAGLAVAAGAHLGALPAHRGEGVVTAGFFLALAVTQLATALVVARGWTAAIRLGVVAGNLGVLALWAWSRTAGIPFGAHAGVPEAVGLLDLTAAGAQAVAVAAVVMRRRTWTGHAILGPRLALVAVAAVVAVGGAGLVPSSHADHPHDADESSSATAAAHSAIGTHGDREAAAVAPAAGAAPVETPPSAGESSSAGAPGAGHRHDAGYEHAQPHGHP